MNLINDKRRREEGVQKAWLVRREETAYEPNVDSNSGKSFGRNISSSKDEQIRSDRNNDQREDAAVIVINGGEDPGKIAERLKLIEQTFLSYVHNHQQRLEARLDESRTVEQNFLASIRELEIDINSLTSKEKQLELSSQEITQTDENP